LPAVLLTGYAGDSGILARRVASDGSFTLLRKPIAAADLIACLRTLRADKPDTESPPEQAAERVAGMRQEAIL
jgi:hypothetical protein